MKFSIHVHNSDGDEGFIDSQGEWNEKAEIDGGLYLIPGIVRRHEQTYDSTVQRIYVRIEEEKPAK